MPMTTQVKTASTCLPPETVQGTHVFDIRSGVFDVAGYSWVLFVYPDGYGAEAAAGLDFVSAYLRLLSTGCGKVRASCDLRLVNPATGAAVSVHPSLVAVRELDPDADGGARVCHCMCIGRGELEGPYLRDDRLTIECVVTVRKEPRVSRTRALPSIRVPGSNLKRQLAGLLESGDGADVAFAVAGETFAAHRLVLALRSPVFKAELCGPMRELGGAAQPIAVEDMQPEVFRAMLHFIYTDSMDRSDDDLGRDYHGRNCDMVRHLLVAADRYAIERLKLTCQSILCRNLDVKNVATTLALADQHHCDRLKQACVEFMCFANNMEAVVDTQGYKDLAATSPSVLAEAMVRMSKVGKKLTKKALGDAPPKS
ncbi:BTB/POZ and MATH domain-containing protein 2-like [Panicum virgatum]|uniref:BTB domain-containing protein n=1 Tax=Panicum virgatum TaxID=38727 RepID=A0A8T0RAI3_PANVG|nr:BTB/POZ and MATH domain-containing protein 2-like [Panicum virgatum]KAG2582504.1 hypothetical protein PVAP13_6KG110014 [Panicum virgatum]